MLNRLKLCEAFPNQIKKITFYIVKNNHLFLCLSEKVLLGCLHVHCSTTNRSIVGLGLPGGSPQNTGHWQCQCLWHKILSYFHMHCPVYYHFYTGEGAKITDTWQPQIEP